MHERGPTRPADAGTWADGLGTVLYGRLVLDRRRFLQLLAASGLAAAAGGAAARTAWGQSASLTPASTDRITDLAASLGRDLQRMFTFVRDEIRFEPYVGLLRGPGGTLLARAGNSVDQSTLLAELLQRSGHEVRFVAGPLADPAAEAILASIRVDAQTALAEARQRAFGEQDLAEGVTWVAEAALPADLTARLPTLDQLVTELDAGWTEVETIATDQLDRAVRGILAGLADVDVTIPVASSQLPERELRSHTWLQAGDGSGGWVDLDPSHPDAIMGDAFGVPGEPFGVVPDSERHAVTLRVLGETYSGGTLSQVPLLGVTWFADQLRDVGLMLSHVPSDSLGSDIDIVGGVGGGTLYNPVLFAGSDAYVGERAVVVGGGGGGGGLFGDALGGGGGEGLADGETSAEWLDVVVTSPGSEPVTARRALFDRVGSSVRASGTLDPASIPPAELVDLGDGLGAQFLPCRAVRAFRVASGPVNAKAMLEGVGLKGASVGSLLAGAFGLYQDIHGADLATAWGWRLVDGGPSVASWDFESTLDGSRTSPDLWHRSFATVELEGGSPSVPAGIVAGVIPHVIERVSVGDTGAAAPSTAGGLSVGNIFDRAAAEGIPTRAFRETLPVDAPYQDEHRRSIAAALDAGYVVIVPERAVDIAGRPRLGWWMVDPLTGAAQDQLDDGRQAAENVPTRSLVATALLRAGPFAMMGAGQAAQYGPRFYWLWYQLMQDLQQLRNLGGG